MVEYACDPHYQCPSERMHNLPHKVVCSSSLYQSGCTDI